MLALTCGSFSTALLKYTAREGDEKENRTQTMLQTDKKRGVNINGGKGTIDSERSINSETGRKEKKDKQGT